jgi:hypothetical protein
MKNTELVKLTAKNNSSTILNLILDLETGVVEQKKLWHRMLSHGQSLDLEFRELSGNPSDLSLKHSSRFEIIPHYYNLVNERDSDEYWGEIKYQPKYYIKSIAEEWIPYHHEDRYPQVSGNAIQKISDGKFLYSSAGGPTCFNLITCVVEKNPFR